MTWRFLLALGVVAAGGCSTGGDRVTPGNPLAALPPQLGAGAVVAPEPVVARAQKSDGKAPPVNVLDLLPERPAGAPQGPAAASIRATVNGEAILDEEVIFAAMQSLASARSAEEQTEILNQTITGLVERELLYQEAVARLKGPPGLKVLDKLREEANKEFDKNTVRRLLKAQDLKSEEQLAAFLREHGMSLDLWRRSNERYYIGQAYLHFRVGSYLSRIGHREILDYYEKHPEEFQFADSVQWQDLFVDALKHPTREAARAFAEVLANRARGGEDFVRLAQEYDNGDSQYRKYEGAGHKHGEVRPPEAEPVLFRMKEGEVAVVEIGSGYHVVRLVKREHAGPMPFDDKVQKRIRDELRRQVMQREAKRIIRELRVKAVVDIASLPKN
jgi:peptidyl-prolyl cis-trans isomerase SurA